MPRLVYAIIGAAALAVPALADDTAEIEARLAAFAEAFNAGDAAGVAALYTEDAIALPPAAAMAEGREAIQALWQGALDAGYKDLSTEIHDLEIVGDVAIETSTLEVTVPTENGEAVWPGKYVIVWKKGDDGWLIDRDIWNAQPAE